MNARTPGQPGPGLPPEGALRQHLEAPRHVGEVAEPDWIGEVASPRPGRSLRLTVALDGQGRIREAAWRGDVEGATLAACSLLAERARGRTLPQVLATPWPEVLRELGPLPEGMEPPEPVFPAALAAALPAAAFRARQARPAPADEDLVCWCFHVTAGTVRGAIREGGLTDDDQVREATRAGGGCGTCRPDVQTLLREAWRRE